MAVAMTHPDHGTLYAESKSDQKRLEGLGWSVRPDDWKAKRDAERAGEILEARKAELARLQAEVAQREAVAAEPAKPVIRRRKGG